MTTREIEELLRSVGSTGVAPRTVNKVRQLVCAIFNYGARPSTYGLASNPAKLTDRRREPDPAPLAFYSPEEIEQLARALADGSHRDLSWPALGADEIAARAREDAQDAELVRLAAYAGLRRGELVALHWRDVDFAGHKITCGGRSRGTPRSSRLRAAPRARYRSRARRPPLWSACASAASSPVPTTTCSRIGSVAA